MSYTRGRDYKPGQVVPYDPWHSMVDWKAKQYEAQLQAIAERDKVDQHTPGAKLDNGKPRAALVLGGFARALMEVAKVGTFGANKYTDNGWKEVENGFDRYSDAGMRHWLKQQMGEKVDDESELPHLAHEAWNALARLEFYLKENETNAEDDS